MHEILRHVPASGWVLDLGSAAGSYDSALYPCRTIHVDLEAPSGPSRRVVRADAAGLPFISGAFDGVICNHSLEHFENLEAALAEIGRVVRPGGALYVAVPDATTFSDWLYRKLLRGGGHVNRFVSAERLVAQIELWTGLRHAGTRVLYTSLSFLNRRYWPRPRPRRIYLVGGGGEGVLFWLNCLLRACDRRLGTRLSVYGWALYFGAIKEPLDMRFYINVCIRCGSGHPSDWLVERAVGRRNRFGVRSYFCPNCGALNPLFGHDKDNNPDRLCAYGKNGRQSFGT